MLVNKDSKDYLYLPLSTLFNEHSQLCEMSGLTQYLRSHLTFTPCVRETSNALTSRPVKHA